MIGESPIKSNLQVDNLQAQSLEGYVGWAEFPVLDRLKSQMHTVVAVSQQKQEAMPAQPSRRYTRDRL